MRSGEPEKQGPYIAKKKLETYGKKIAQYTDIFTTANPDVIEEVITEFISDQGFEAQASKDKYKIKFEHTSTETFKNGDNEAEEIEKAMNICIRILKINKSKVCVECTKVKGDKVSFNKYLKEFREYLEQKLSEDNE